MAGAAVDAAMSAVSPSSRPSYLKSYPYLFVRETDQTDYFCTICEESLKEDQLQSHLFETHSAENLQEYFVRVSQSNKKYLYICVVCWAKLGSTGEMVTHRETCKVSFGDDSNDNTMDGVEPTDVVSTPDIPGMMDDDDNVMVNGNMNGHNGAVSPPPFPHPEVIIDTDVSQQNFPKFSETMTPANNKKQQQQELSYSSQCMQCSLCTMVLPSTSYLHHLKTYHRVTCPLTSASCPLCMTSVPIMDLTVHLASQHGLVPQSAVNALLLWVLTSNTFALNDSAQTSLKSKFKGQQQQQQQQQQNQFNAGLMTSSTPKLKAQITQNNNKSKTTPATSTPVNNKTTTTTTSTTTKPETLINDLRGKVPVENIIGNFTRSHMGPGGKESHQCLVCSKWYAIPPIKHLRSHITQFSKEKKRVQSLANGAHICLLCYKLFDGQQAAAAHVSTHTPEGLPGGASSGGLLAEALLGFPRFAKQEQQDSNDDLPLGATFETPGLKPNSPAPSVVSNKSEMINVELDNAGRVKSGKVRKQCELCGEWSNIKWFFKHMSEVHDALFCRCCREYLPIHEHKEHRHWHQMPPYMGQKIRIEEGQPIIIDRKERASLTPIGSLAAWGGSSGGLVVKAVDEVVNRKRKADKMSSSVNSPTSVKTGSGSSTAGADLGQYQLGMLPPEIPATTSLPSLDDESGRDSLMPKERCPVCHIEITHKNLARHIKLRHGHMYAEHKTLHETGQLESVPLGAGDKHLEFFESCKTDDEDDAIEIPEEMLDQALDSNGSRKKDEQFRANTSMTKLESLMGKEFKHPRRKCQICGYSVSYSNFKRHMRNAHPGELETDPSLIAGDFITGDSMSEMMGHHMDDTDRVSYNASAAQDEDKNEMVEGYVECRKCGDHVMKEFLGRHQRMIHGEEPAPVKQQSPRPRNIIMRACPECGVEMRSDSITKHCKLKHKVSYRYCSACAKYIQKKSFKSHLKKHESGELTGEVTPEDNEDNDDNELDTSKDDEDDELIIEDDAVEIEDIENEDDDNEEDAAAAKPTPTKIYNCVDCTRMFMSAEAHANHLRDVHGGEGGSVVLKLPVDKTVDKKVDQSVEDEDMQMDEDNEDKADELVIDDSQE